MKKQNSTIDEKIEKMEKQEKIESKNDKIKYGPGKRGGLIIGTVSACIVFVVGGGLLVSKLAGSSKYQNRNSVAVFTGLATEGTTKNTENTKTTANNQTTPDIYNAVGEVDNNAEANTTNNEAEHGDYPDAPPDDDTIIRDSASRDNIISVEPDIISTIPSEYNFVDSNTDSTTASQKQTQNGATDSSVSPTTTRKQTIKSTAASTSTRKQTTKSTAAPTTTKDQTSYSTASKTESITKASTPATPASTSTEAKTTSDMVQSSGSGGTRPPVIGTISSYTTFGDHLSDWFD